jgi:uncharacterized protein
MRAPTGARPTAEAMTPIIATLVAHPWRSSIAALAVVTTMAWPAATIRTDNSLAVWFVADDPAVASFHAFLDEFGSDEAVVVAYRAPGPPDAAEWALQRVAAERVAGVDGVERVLSGAVLADLPGVVGPDPLRSLGLLAGEDVLSFVAWLEARPDLDAERGRVLDAIDAALAATLGAAGRDYRLAGTGVLYEGLNRQTERDAAVFLGLAIGVMAILLRLVLGRWRAVAVALAAPLLATVATVGLVGWTGRSMNVVLATLPALILVIGVADAVHIFIEYYRQRRARPAGTMAERRALAVDVVGRMAVPCLFTSVTTGLALLALLSSRMAVVQELGAFAAVGVMLVWALVVLSTALALAYLDIPPPRVAFGVRLASPLARLASWVRRRRPQVMVGSAAVGVLMLLGVARITVDTHTIGLLPPGHRVVEDSDWIEQNLGHYMPLEFVVEVDSGSVLRPDVLGRIRVWQAVAALRPEVDRTLGAIELLGLAGDPLAGEAAAESAAAALASATGDDLRGYVSADRRRARVTAFVPMGTAREFATTAAALEAEGTDVLGGVARVTATGYLPLYVRIIDYTVSSAVLGLVLAFGAVFLVLALLFRTPRSVLAAIPPNLLAVATVFGALGWLGIPLDIATATVGAIVLGIGVDDTVHYLHRWRVARDGGDPDPATAAILEAGPGMVLSSAVLVLGLGVLLAAGSLSIVYFGILITLALGAALVADLVLLPALLGPGPAARPDQPGPGPR